MELFLHERPEGLLLSGQATIYSSIPTQLNLKMKSKIPSHMHRSHYHPTEHDRQEQQLICFISCYFHLMRTVIILKHEKNFNVFFYIIML